MDHRQPFTRKEIEKDLKHAYRKQFILGLCSLPLIIILWFLILKLFELKSEDPYESLTYWGYLIIIILFTAISLYTTCYSAIKTFTHLKYTIVTDNFLYEEEIQSRYDHYLTFYFKCYGEYIIDCHTVRAGRLYHWSKDCALWGKQLKGVTSQNEEFYLIIVDNRIAYIYSTRVFKFIETKQT